MALIEIDVSTVDDGPVVWNLKFNTEKRCGVEDYEVANLTSFNDVLRELRSWMHEEADVVKQRIGR